METTLHRQLKELYREPGAPIEVPIGKYRIDVINGRRLVEVQRSSLSSIRTKIGQLLADGFTVDVVKPLIQRKKLVKLDGLEGTQIDQRWSPRQGNILDFFDELMYFRTVFPHPNLTLHVPLISIQETRYPGHGRKRRRRKGSFLIQDQQMMELHRQYEFGSIKELINILPTALPAEFDTKQMSDVLSVSRDQAQRIAYVLREIKGIIVLGKRNRSWLYRMATTKEIRQIMPKVSSRLKKEAAKKVDQAKVNQAKIDQAKVEQLKVA